MEKLDLVVKIGSMALIQKDENAIDYNIFQRLGGDLRPGMILVTSGATEIGRLDYLKRTGHELTGVTEQDKVDYSAQGSLKCVCSTSTCRMPYSGRINWR